MKNNKFVNGLLILVFSLVLLYWGKPFLMPVVMAFFVWFIIRIIRKLLLRIPFIKKNIPTILVNIVSGLLLGTFVFFAVDIIMENITSLLQSSSKYDANLAKITNQINTQFNINLNNSVKEMVDGLNFNDIFSTAFDAISTIVSNTLIILIYVIFIFMEEKMFVKKLSALYPDLSDRRHSEKIFDNIDSSVSKYISIKTLTSLLTGLFSLIALEIMHVDGAAFWAFLIFIMNYIPNIGSIIATLFPTIFALVQFGDINTMLMVGVVIGIIQVAVGNGIEPMLMGDSLNISPLVVLVALALWGGLWGIIGMVLSVPITVVMIIVFSEFPATRPISVILSKSGNLSTGVNKIES